jgi:hypothetical protein
VGSERRRFTIDRLGLGERVPEKPKELSAERKTLIHRYMTDAVAADDKIAGASERNGAGREAPARWKPTAAAAAAAAAAKAEVEVPHPVPERAGGTGKKPVLEKPAAEAAGAHGRSSAANVTEPQTVRPEPAAVRTRAPRAVGAATAPAARASAAELGSAPLTERWQFFFWEHRVELLVYSLVVVLAVAIGVLISQFGG